MNKKCYRIVFNAKRGLRMAVAETATAQGKNAAGETRGGLTGSLTATLRPSSFAISAALGLVLWAQAPARAQIVADPAAPAGQRPTVLQTANGLPQVNIQTPSAAGVSRNTYSQFDVSHPGAILNNSRSNVPTQTGGWVQGNPWLATGSARVILNEVNSANPSQLKGYVEVAGQRAEVIIANPAGIAVNGGGFLNASGVTLTTGTPVMNGGSLEAYRVQRGSVSIEGAGLDTSTADYTNILARAVQVNAGIWAKDLKVVTGANDIAASNAAAPTVISATTASDAAPAYLLDVSQLGGMYAGKIFLVGTETGLGVRNAGVIGAIAGDVVLQDDGWLSNSGSIRASGNAQVTTQGDITNTGTLYASGHQTVSSIGNVSNSGLIAAQGNTTITANSLGSSANSVLGAGIKTDGTLTTSGNLSITTLQRLSANGQTLASGDATLSGSSVDTSVSQTANLQTGEINNNSGLIQTGGNLTIASSGDVRNGGKLQAGQTLSLNANNIDNAATGEITGATTQINAANTLANRGSLMARIPNLTPTRSTTSVQGAFTEIT
jgi:filamentous hemagglutinin